MMSRQAVTGAFLIGVLVAAPAMAQRQRNPGGGGGAPRVSQGGRQVAAPQGGGRAVAGRSAQQPRPYVAPPAATRPAAPSRYGAERYAAPRAQAYTGDSYVARRHPGPVAGQVAPRANVAPGYGATGYAERRGYVGRPVDPGYGVRPGYGARPGYAARPGYVAPRSYAVPRGYVAPRPYGHGGYYGGYHGRPYYGRPGYYYGPPRYVAPGWRGPWGYAVLTPRFIYPPVVSIGFWQPYFYRPSIGLGVYYGADGLYPFGAVPQAYYDPSPGVVYGGLRIVDAPRDAQVFADGNYVGIVDDFDGVTQHLNLEAGRHRIEIHAPGLTPIAFDVDVVAGQTMTLQAEIR